MTLPIGNARVFNTLYSLSTFLCQTNITCAVHHENKEVVGKTFPTKSPKTRNTSISSRGGYIHQLPIYTMLTHPIFFRDPKAPQRTKSYEEVLAFLAHASITRMLQSHASRSCCCCCCCCCWRSMLVVGSTLQRRRHAQTTGFVCSLLMVTCMERIFSTYGKTGATHRVWVSRRDRTTVDRREMHFKLFLQPCRFASQVSKKGTRSKLTLPLGIKCRQATS